MPVTDGSLTQRLGQLVTDIGVFFSTVGNKLDSTIVLLTDINATLTQMVAPTAVANKRGFANVEQRLQILNDALPTELSYLNQTQAIITQMYQQHTVSLPDLLAALRYVTQSGDGTPLARNLQSVINTVFDLGGPLPDHATLWDLRQGLISPTGPRIQEIVEKLDILLDEKLGDVSAPLTAIGLLQMIQICICSVDEKTPALPVDPPTPGLVPNTSLCAAGNSLLWELKPSDWVQDGEGKWYAVPSVIYPAGDGYFLDGFLVPGGIVGTVVLLVAEMDNVNRLTECGVAVSLETGSLETIVRRGFEADSPQVGEATDLALSSIASNVFNTPSGCATMQLVGVEGQTSAMHFSGTLRAGASFPPSETIWFYELPG